MTISDPTADYDLDTTVYDVNGNEVGTMAEIYLEGTGSPVPGAAQPGRPA